MSGGSFEISSGDASSFKNSNIAGFPKTKTVPASAFK
jgi:hypothetical protein